MTGKAANPGSTVRAESPVGRNAWAVSVSILALVAITWLAYLNAWPDTLVYDDKLFMNFEQFSDLSAMPRYFTENVWAARTIESGLYRPLLFVSLLLDTHLFGDWFAGYHLLNILLHSLVAVLVFLLVARLLANGEDPGRKEWYLALLAAAVFSAHPAHTEVVNSVFNRSALLSAIGSLAGLLCLLRFLDTRPLVAWGGLFLAYLFALFSRETAIVLPGLAAALVYIFSPGAWLSRIRKALPVLVMLVPMVFYLFMREQALEAFESGRIADMETVPGIIAQVDPSRLLEGSKLLEVSGVLLNAFAVLLWPFDPRLYYADLSRNLQWLGLLLHVSLLVLAWWQFLQGRKGLLAGLVVFYITFLPASRLFGAGSVTPHLQIRYLYMPAIGLAIALGFALGYVRRRFDALGAAAPALLMVVLSIPITWARNVEWSDEIRLFEADYHKGVRASNLLRVLTGAHLREGNFARVIEICEEASRMKHLPGGVTVHCASAYSYTGQQAKAEQAYLFATQEEPSRVLAHTNLAMHYMRLGRQDDAKLHFEEAVAAERNPALKAYRQGLMIIHLHTNDRAKLLEARKLLQESLNLDASLGDARNWLERLNEVLDEGPGDGS